MKTFKEFRQQTQSMNEAIPLVAGGAVAAKTALKLLGGQLLKKGAMTALKAAPTALLRNIPGDTPSKNTNEEMKVNKKLTPPNKMYTPKENCYGKTVDYKMAPGKKVCAKNTSGGGGDEE